MTTFLWALMLVVALRWALTAMDVFVFMLIVAAAMSGCFNLMEALW